MAKKDKNDKPKKADKPDIHRLVGRIHRLGILIGKGAEPTTISRYNMELEEKEAELLKFSEQHKAEIDKEFKALGY